MTIMKIRKKKQEANPKRFMIGSLISYLQSSCVRTWNMESMDLLMFPKYSGEIFEKNTFPMNENM